MTGPRNYTVGTERAVYQLSQGTCYVPDCDVPAIRFVDDSPYSNLQIAHIRGANPESARYDPDMTDDDRASFDNLLLLCKLHHGLVDRRNPDHYPADTLREWERQREEATVDDTQQLAGITDTQLELHLEDVATRLSPQRQVETEPTAGALLPERDRLATGPFDGFYQMLEVNPDVHLEPVVVVHVRNVGSLPATVKNVDPYVSIPFASCDEPATNTLHDLNEYPLAKPELRARIEDGDSKKWVYTLETVETMIDGADHIDLRLQGVHAEVSLATGETTRSETVPVETTRTVFANPD